MTYGTHLKVIKEQVCICQVEDDFFHTVSHILY